MKKYLSFILLLFVVFSSCKDMLLENPKSFLSPDQFFNSDNEAIAGVNGAYSTCYFVYGGNTYDIGYYSSMGTDIARPTGGRESTFNYHTYTLSSSDQGDLGNVWINLYKGVANCNMVIDRVSNNPKISSSVNKQVLGEALFLRSLYYYWLTCLWGDVPMWLNKLDVIEISGPISRTPVAAIRQQMISDLKVAAANLPASYSGTNLGRASKWAANMLLCNYYLWEKDWKNAKAIATDIIAQQGGTHKLLTNYADIWGPANEYSAEAIWEIDFTVTTHATSFTDRFMPRQVDEPTVPGFPMTGYGLLTSTNEFLATFDPNDLRKKWYDWNGNGTIKTKYHYVLKQMNFSEARNNHGMNSRVFRMADAYLMFAEAENELNGPTVDGYAKINAIRKRAGLTDLTALTKEQFRQAVRNERKWELSFEFQHRWDLNRWGILVEAVKSISVTNPAGAANIKDYHQLFPIPTREMSLNPELKQNPGY